MNRPLEASSIPGPPHIIEAAKAEAYREIIDRIIELHPEVMVEVLEQVQMVEGQPSLPAAPGEAPRKER